MAKENLARVSSGLKSLTQSRANALPIEVLVIGASAGGIPALRAIMQRLPSDLPLLMVCVLHIPADSSLDFTGAIDDGRDLVREGEDKMKPNPGLLYLAPAGYHLLFELDGYFALNVDPPVNNCRPAIDVLFESAAMVFGERVAGLVLTGANHDGTAGLAAIKAQGGLALVQDPATAEVETMPRHAMEQVAVDGCIPLAEIPELIFLLSKYTEKQAAAGGQA